MRKFFTKKKIIIGAVLVIVILIIGYKISRGRTSAAGILTDTVKKQDLQQTVLATGEVTSSSDLSLSFKGSGVVSSIKAVVGQQVKANTVLANLSQSDQAASLTSARGALAQAQANYNKVVAGASGPDIDVAKAAVTAAQTTLSNAQKSLADTESQQSTLVGNALRAMLNSTLAAVSTTNSVGSAPTISGTYSGIDTGSYKIAFTSTGSGLGYVISGLESVSGSVNTNAVVPLGTKGLFIQFASNTSSTDTWVVNIPNTQAANYVTNLNSYNAAVQTQQSAMTSAQNAVASAQSALDQANAALALKQSAARPEDIAVAQAQILSAQGQVQAASAALENTVIRAPSDGTVTSVDIKVGEQATPTKEAIIVQDVNDLHVEANVSEANIASVQPGQQVTFTFDALGPDRSFTGAVQTIDPASTVVSGVVNYKVTASVDKLPDIKPGMTANMTILAASKQGVLAVSQRAVLNHDGKKFVRVVDDSKKKTYHEVEVTTGMDADGGLVEIVSGLNAGQEIVTFVPTK